MYDIDNTQAQSVTATVCENAQLYGATPERDEFDPREVWDADDAMGAVSEAFRIIAEGVGPDGTQLADERESLLWGFVNRGRAAWRSGQYRTISSSYAWLGIAPSKSSTTEMASRLGLNRAKCRRTANARFRFRSSATSTAPFPNTTVCLPAAWSTSLYPICNEPAVAPDRSIPMPSHRCKRR